MLGVRRPESESLLCVALDLQQVKSALNPFPHIYEYYEFMNVCMLLLLGPDIFPTLTFIHLKPSLQASLEAAPLVRIST